MYIRNFENITYESFQFTKEGFDKNFLKRFEEADHILLSIAPIHGVDIVIKNFKDNFKHLHGKISKAVFSLRIMKNLLDKRHLKLLYNSYIKSHIEYCCNIFCLANKSYIKPILLLQKRAIRIICGANYRDHTQPLFKHEHILPINELIKFNIFKFMFDYRNDFLPIIFHGTWQSCNTPRFRNDFRLAHANSMRLKDHHPLFAFPSLWNKIYRTLNIKNLGGKKEFRQTLFNQRNLTLDKISEQNDIITQQFTEEKTMLLAQKLKIDDSFQQLNNSIIAGIAASSMCDDVVMTMYL